MKKWPVYIWVFLVSYVFFLFNLAENFSSPHDSITYLNGIVSGQHLVNQHHLLYHFSAYAWLRIWQLLLPFVKDYYLLEAFTALWGSATLAVVYCFFRNRFRATALASILSTSVVAFSYGFWFYSVNIEVYAPPLFFLLLSLYIITRDKFLKRDVPALILLHVAAVLFHQVNILFTIVVLWKFWKERSSIGYLRPILLYAASGIVLVGGCYFLVGWFVENQNTWPLWTNWMLGYTREEGYWHAPGIKTLMMAGYGFAHAFIGAHFVFSVGPLQQMLQQSLASHSLTDELFIARNISPAVSMMLLVLSALLCLLILVMLVRLVIKFRTARNTYGFVLGPLLLSFFVYSLFFCFWEPEILEFWIFQSILFWLVLLGTWKVTMGKLRIKHSTGAFIIALLLFFINYFGSMRFLKDKRNDWYYSMTLPLMDAASKNDLILLQEGWILDGYMKYYTGAAVQETGSPKSDFTNVDSMVKACLAAGNKVYILPETFSSRFEHQSKYLDSLQNSYQGRVSIFKDTAPRILVIQ